MKAWTKSVTLTDTGFCVVCEFQAEEPDETECPATLIDGVGKYDYVIDLINAYGHNGAPVNNIHHTPAVVLHHHKLIRFTERIWPAPTARFWVITTLGTQYVTHLWADPQ